MVNEYKVLENTDAEVKMFNMVTRHSDLCKEVSSFSLVEVSPCTIP